MPLGIDESLEGPHGGRVRDGRHVVRAHRQVPLGVHAVRGRPQLIGYQPMGVDQLAVHRMLGHRTWIGHVKGDHVPLQHARHGFGHLGQPGGKRSVLRQPLTACRRLRHTQTLVWAGPPAVRGLGLDVAAAQRGGGPDHWTFVAFGS